MPTDDALCELSRFEEILNLCDREEQYHEAMESDRFLSQDDSGNDSDVELVHEEYADSTINNTNGSNVLAINTDLTGPTASYVGTSGGEVVPLKKRLNSRR